MRRTTTARRFAALLSAVFIVAGGAIIGVQRARYQRFLYVSELGAEGQPTAEWFRWGLVCLVVGIASVAWVVADVRSRGRLLNWWTPAGSLLAAAACFLLASQVSCSAGCPLAFTDAAAPRDAVHIVSAVLGFAAGAWAMLQLATATDRWMRRISVMSAVLVSGIAGAGGLLSLFAYNTDLGSVLEYVATAIGLTWLITVAVVHTWQRSVPAPPVPASALLTVARPSAGRPPASSPAANAPTRGAGIDRSTSTPRR